MRINTRNLYGSRVAYTASQAGEREKSLKRISSRKLFLSRLDDCSNVISRLHLVTSSLFLSSIHAILSERSQKLLLRGFLSVALTYWVTHNRPSFTINDFFADDSHTLVSPPHKDPVPADDALDPRNLHQNAWFPILQSALTHPDEHLLKIQRSFAHYAALYGTRPKGCLSQTELPEAAAIDGTLFLRLASVTGDVKAWVREGEPSHDANWNRQYGKQE